MSLLITDAGIAASIKAGELGVSYKITHIGIGLEGYIPTADQTELKNEFIRKAITQGSIPVAGQLHFEVVFDDNTAYEAKEIGYYLEDGTLFAVDSRDGEIMSIKRSNTIITEIFEVNLADSSIDNITVEIIGVTAATDEDIDNEATTKRVIELPQFWRGVKKFFSNKYNGESESLVVTEKALKDGLGTKLTQSQADDRYLKTKGQSNPRVEHKGSLTFTIQGDSDDVNEADFVRFDLLADGGNYGMRFGHDGDDNTQYLEVVKAGVVERVFSIGTLQQSSVFDFHRELSTNGSLVCPAWIPLPEPFATPSTGRLECRGQSFDKIRYPELAKGYPTGWLPDLRGEFIRGLDNGRGIDAGRIVLSNQSSSIAPHKHRTSMCANPDTVSKLLYGADTETIVPKNKIDDLGGGDLTEGGEHPVYTESTGVEDTYPRNKAFIFSVRAA